MIMIANRRTYRAAQLLLLLSLAFVSAARAQGNEPSPDSAPGSDEPVVAASPAEAQPKPLTNYVETGGNYLTLTNGFGHWDGGYARAVYEKASNVWNAEMNGQQEFGDAGVYFAAGDTHTFN